VVDHYARFKNRFQKAFGFRAALVDLHLRIKRDLTRSPAVAIRS
jgi:hypothetical protein